MENKGYQVVGKDNVTLFGIFNREIGVCYTPKENNIVIYHTLGSTIILSLTRDEDGNLKKGLFRILTESENLDKIVGFIKQITKSEVKQTE